MSLSQTAYLERSLVPDRSALNEAIRSLGFNLVVDDSYRPFESSGFLPCSLNGALSGFEIYFGSSAESSNNLPHIKEQIGKRDCTIEFCWGGDMAECACVLATSAALAKSFGAIVHYGADDLVYSWEQLVEETKGALADIKPAKPERKACARKPKKPWWKIW